MRRSKLPVYRTRNTHAAIAPSEVSTANGLKTESDHLQPSAKRFHVIPSESKNDLPRRFNFSRKTSSAVTFEATSKQQNVALNKRKKIPPSSRMTRADMKKNMAPKVVEAELRDQNQLLEVAQQQLKQELKVSKAHVENLQRELETWRSNTMETREMFQDLRLKLQNAKEESNKIVGEMDLFDQELEDWRSTLSQFNHLLDQDVE